MLRIMYKCTSCHLFRYSGLGTLPSGRGGRILSASCYFGCLIVEQSISFCVIKYSILLLVMSINIAKKTKFFVSMLIIK